MTTLILIALALKLQFAVLPGRLEVPERRTIRNEEQPFGRRRPARTAYLPCNQ